MEILNPSALAEQLKLGQINESKAKTYLVATLALEALSSSLSGSRSERGLVMELVTAIAMVLVTIWGLNLCYEANGGANGKEFIKRYTCLSLPVDIILGLIALGAMVIAVPIIVTTVLRGPASVEGQQMPPMHAMIGLFIGVTVRLIGYEWKRKLIKKVAASEPPAV